MADLKDIDVKELEARQEQKVHIYAKNKGAENARET